MQFNFSFTTFPSLSFFPFPSLSATLCCFVFSLQMGFAQGVAWGTAPQIDIVAVDTTDGIRLAWDNNLNGSAGAFSDLRFYHVWIEQEVSAGVWQVPGLNGHFYVSDTTWLAESTLPLADTASLIRFRIVPIRSVTSARFSANNSTTATTTWQEFPQFAKISSPISPISNTVSRCCLITVIIDTRPAGGTCTGGTTLADALANTTALQVERNGVMQPFATIGQVLATAHPNKLLNIEVKERLDCSIANTQARPLFYQNSTLTVATQTTAVANSNQTLITNQTDKLLDIIENRLKTYYNQPNVGYMTIKVVVD
jgi:hypothetical protein